MEGKKWLPLRAVSDDVDAMNFDKRRDAQTLQKLTRIVCYPDLQTSPEKDVCIFIFGRAVVLTVGLFSESFHHWGREAIQSFPAHPLCRAPPGPGPAAVPGRGLDPVQGEGVGRGPETQRQLQQECNWKETALEHCGAISAQREVLGTSYFCFCTVALGVAGYLSPALLCILCNVLC